MNHARRSTPPPALRRRRAPRPCLAAAAALLLCVVARPAQTRAESGQPADGRISIEAIGLSLALPPGASVSREAAAIGRAIVAVEAGRQPSWSLRIQAIDATVDPPTPDRQIQELVFARTQIDPTSRMVESRELSAAGRTGTLAVLEEGGTGGRPYAYVALGCLDLKPGLLLLSGRARDQATLDRVIDQVVATIEIRALAVVGAERKVRLRKGAARVAAMTESILRPLVGRDDWFRTWMAGPDGAAVEVACLRVEILEGPRGAVEPSRLARDYSPAERGSGFIVRVTARSPVREGIVRNSQLIHWMAWDGSDEQWAVRSTVSDGVRSSSDVVTGIRAARSPSQPGGLLTVVTDSQRGSSTPPGVWSVPDAYLSQPLRWVLGPLLHATEAPEGTYAWYSIDASTAVPELSYREDRWRRSGDGYRLETQTRPGGPRSVSMHDAAGRLLSRESEDGIRMERTTPEAIVRLWRSKGLPTGSLQDLAGR